MVGPINDFRLWTSDVTILCRTPLCFHIWNITLRGSGSSSTLQTALGFYSDVTIITRQRHSGIRYEIQLYSFGIETLSIPISEGGQPFDLALNSFQGNVVVHYSFLDTITEKFNVFSSNSQYIWCEIWGTLIIKNIVSLIRQNLKVPIIGPNGITCKIVNEFYDAKHKCLQGHSFVKKCIQFYATSFRFYSTPQMQANWKKLTLTFEKTKSKGVLIKFFIKFKIQKKRMFDLLSQHRVSPTLRCIVSGTNTGHLIMGNMLIVNLIPHVNAIHSAKEV